MRFSIVIPAHNGERYIEEAIASALGQVRKADEIIVIDDQSSDGTAEIARSYAKERGILYLYNATATGFVDAWNRSIAAVSGDFVTILHQDDLLHPEYLTHVEKALTRYPHVRHIYAACNYIDENGQVKRDFTEPLYHAPVLFTGKEYARNYLNGVVANRHIHRCPGVTTSRQLLLHDCSYRKEAGHIADDDFFLRVGYYTDVVGISAPLASYRHHSDSATSRSDCLTLKLAEDYLFQIRSNKNSSPLLDSEHLRLIHSIGAKFVNLLLFQGIAFGNTEHVSTALILKNEYDELLPDIFWRLLPPWARLMWICPKLNGKKNCVVKAYVNLIKKTIQVRNSFK